MFQQSLVKGEPEEDLLLKVLAPHQPHPVPRLFRSRLTIAEGLGDLGASGKNVVTFAPLRRVLSTNFAEYVYLVLWALVRSFPPLQSQEALRRWQFGI